METRQMTLPKAAYFNVSEIFFVACSAWATIPWPLKCTPSGDQYSAWSCTKP